MQTEYQSEITDRQRKALKWIMMGVAHREIYDCMYALPFSSSNGSQSGELEKSRFNCPEGFSLNCPACENETGQEILTYFVFDPKHLNVPFSALSGVLSCKRCKTQSYRLWLTNPQTTSPYNQWQQAWVDKKPGLPELPSDVDDDQYRELFDEIVRLLPTSSRAAAVIGRYLIQRILRDKVGVTNASLKNECNEAINNPNVPSYLTDRLHSCRIIGNWAAHPDKTSDPSEFIGVEPGEAEWLLDTVKDFLDFYFVRPNKIQAQHDEVNRKRTEAGMNPIDFTTGSTIPGGSS